jgi:hypothetical protein
MIASPVRWIRARVLVLTFLLVGLLAWPVGAWASLDNDRYDGNIFALYAGNGSLVPPRLTLAQSLADHRVTLLVFYLDDSAVSKRFAGVVSELQRVWGNSIELMPLVTDPLQGRVDAGASDPLHYWRGVIPQVVVLGQEGQVVLDAPGQVEIDTIHAALSKATGLPLPPSSSERRMTSFNELNDGWQAVSPDASSRE